jgi:hypothetical protein
MRSARNGITTPGEVDLRFECTGGNAELTSFELWEMGSCWEE